MPHETTSPVPFDQEWSDAQLSGIEDIQPAFPFIKIVQATSTMTGGSQHLGHFYFTDTEEFVPELDCVPLVRRQTRAMFSDGETTPVCMSADGVVPLPGQSLWETGKWFDAQKGEHRVAPSQSQAGSNAGRQPRACGECPLSEWEDDTPPPCGAADVWLVLRDGGDGEPAQLRIKGKGIRPSRNWIRRACVQKKLPLFAFRLSISTEERNEPGKKWFQPVFTSEELPPAKRAEYRAFLIGERQRFERGLMAAEGEANVEWDDADDPGYHDAPAETPPQETPPPPPAKTAARSRPAAPAAEDERWE